MKNVMTKNLQPFFVKNSILPLMIQQGMQAASMTAINSIIQAQNEFISIWDSKVFYNSSSSYF